MVRRVALDEEAIVTKVDRLVLAGRGDLRTFGATGCQGGGLARHADFGRQEAFKGCSCSDHQRVLIRQSETETEITVRKDCAVDLAKARAEGPDGGCRVVAGIACANCERRTFDARIGKAGLREQRQIGQLNECVGFRQGECRRVFHDEGKVIQVARRAFARCFG